MAQTDMPNGMHVAHDSALSVGSAADAVKIRELQDQVDSLAQKAKDASQQCAEYLNQIAEKDQRLRVLEAQKRQLERKQERNASGDQTDGAAQAVAQPSLSRFGSLMHSRKPTNGAVQQVGNKELEENLVRERTQRIEAETRAKKLEAEIEELSVTLFQQANEMVAAERKENAGLKARISQLEEHAASQTRDGMEALQSDNAKLKEKLRIMEQRDVDRRRRLEKLEAANKRIERVRALLVPR